MNHNQSAQRIVQIGMAFWGSKVLMTAVSLGLFAALAEGPLDTRQLTSRLELHPRGARDFFDALVSLGLLERNDDLYANTPEVDLLFDRAKPSYIGGWFELTNSRLYPVWGLLDEALRTGQPQNEAKQLADYYGNLCSAPARLNTFLSGMSGLSMETARVVASAFPWRDYRTFADIGGAQGTLGVQLALANQHLTGITLDLAPVEPYFHEHVAAFGLADRLRFQPGDFFADALPTADVLVMGHVLHNWNLDEKRLLIRKAYEALPEGGALLVYEALLDDERRQNTFGLLMSLNMLLVTHGGFVFTGTECQGWMREAGFRATRVEHLTGPDSMVIGIK